MIKKEGGELYGNDRMGKWCKSYKLRQTKISYFGPWSIDGQMAEDEQRRMFVSIFFIFRTLHINLTKLLLLYELWLRRVQGCWEGGFVDTA